MSKGYFRVNRYTQGAGSPDPTEERQTNMTEHLKLLISHGDKGGTGKSMAAALALDHLLATGAPVLLIEGDAGIPDLALRFDGSVPVELVNLNRAGDSETSFNKLGNILEAAASAGQHVVINMPAGAGDTIDELAPVLADVVSAVGYELVVTFSIGPHSTSTDALVKSLQRGLLSVVDPARRSVLFPLFLGIAEQFNWSKSPKRADFISAGGKESSIPALRPDDLRDKVLATPGAFSLLAEDKAALTITERALFRRWLALAHAAIASVV